eukprot:5478134-Amphidinium_carterae.1
MAPTEQQKQMGSSIRGVLWRGLPTGITKVPCAACHKTEAVKQTDAVLSTSVKGVLHRHPKCGGGGLRVTAKETLQGRKSQLRA